MTSRALDPCVTVVAGNPGGTAETPLPHLAATGADLSLLPCVAIVAAAVVLVGAGILMRRRRLAAVAPAIAFLAVTLGVFSSLAVATPSQATNAYGTAQQCALMAVSNVERSMDGEAANLLPGQTADVLSLTVTNVTATPIELRAALAPTGGEPDAFVTDIAEGAEVLATGLLSKAPSTASLTLAPGAHLDLRVSVALASATADAGATATFDAVFTAVSD